LCDASRAGFSWDKLGTFEYKTSLTDFLSSDTLMSFNKPTNLADVQDKLDAVADIFCTPESYNPIQKWPTICYGPVVNITYAPKACIIDEEAKQVICEPARLVLTKTPGYCVLKHYSSASWTGKECKISGMVGFQKLKIAGGTNYTIDLGELATDKMESLKEFWDNHMAPPPS